MINKFIRYSLLLITFIAHVIFNSHAHALDRLLSESENSYLEYADAEKREILLQRLLQRFVEKAAALKIQEKHISQAIMEGQLVPDLRDLRFLREAMDKSDSFTAKPPAITLPWDLSTKGALTAEAAHYRTKLWVDRFGGLHDWQIFFILVRKGLIELNISSSLRNMSRLKESAKSEFEVVRRLRQVAFSPVGYPVVSERKELYKFFVKVRDLRQVIAEAKLIYNTPFSFFTLEPSLNRSKNGLNELIHTQGEKAAQIDYQALREEYLASQRLASFQQERLAHEIDALESPSPTPDEAHLDRIRQARNEAARNDGGSTGAFFLSAWNAAFYEFGDEIACSVGRNREQTSQCREALKEQLIVANTEHQNAVILGSIVGYALTPFTALILWLFRTPKTAGDVFQLHFMSEAIEGIVVTVGEFATFGSMSAAFITFGSALVAGVMRGGMLAVVFEFKRNLMWQLLLIAAVALALLALLGHANTAQAGPGGALTVKSTKSLSTPPVVQAPKQTPVTPPSAAATKGSSAPPGRSLAGPTRSAPKKLPPSPANDNIRNGLSVPGSLASAPKKSTPTGGVANSPSKVAPAKTKKMRSEVISNAVSPKTPRAMSAGRGKAPSKGGSSSKPIASTRPTKSGGAGSPPSRPQAKVLVRSNNALVLKNADNSVNGAVGKGPKKSLEKKPSAQRGIQQLSLRQNRIQTSQKPINQNKLRGGVSAAQISQNPASGGIVAKQAESGIDAAKRAGKHNQANALGAKAYKARQAEATANKQLRDKFNAARLQETRQLSLKRQANERFQQQKQAQAKKDQENVAAHKRNTQKEQEEHRQLDLKRQANERQKQKKLQQITRDQERSEVNQQNAEKRELTPSSASNRNLLAKDLASQSQMQQTGRTIAGTSNTGKFRDSHLFAQEYGGNPSDWVKKSSTTFEAPDGTKFETHWVENLKTLQKEQYKTKIRK